MNIRNKRVYKINSVEKIKEKLFFWGNLYQPVVWLDSNHYPHQEMEYDAILAVGLASNEQFVFSSDKLNLKINGTIFNRTNIFLLIVMIYVFSYQKKFGF